MEYGRNIRDGPQGILFALQLRQIDTGGTEMFTEGFPVCFVSVAPD